MREKGLMGEAAWRERRRYVRISVELPVTLRFGGREVAYPAAFACDVSAEGVGVEIRGSREHFDALKEWKARVETEIHLLDGNALALEAEVAWGAVQDEDGEERLRAGMRFVDVGDAAREILSQFAEQ